MTYKIEKNIKISLTKFWDPNILSADHVVKRAKEGASGTRGDHGSPHFIIRF